MCWRARRRKPGGWWDGDWCRYCIQFSSVPAETFLKNGATMRPPGGMACATLRCWPSQTSSPRDSSRHFSPPPPRVMQRSRNISICYYLIHHSSADGMVSIISITTSFRRQYASCSQQLELLAIDLNYRVEERGRDWSFSFCLYRSQWWGFNVSGENVLPTTADSLNCSLDAPD